MAENIEIDQEEFKKAIDEIINCFIQVDDYRDEANSLIKELKTKTGKSATTIRKVATTLYKQSEEKLNTENSEINHLIDFYRNS